MKYLSNGIREEQLGLDIERRHWPEILSCRLRKDTNAGECLSEGKGHRSNRGERISRLWHVFKDHRKHTLHSLHVT